MKKLAFTAVAVVALGLSSAIAGSCPGGGCGDKDKSDKKKDSTTQTAAPVGVAI